MPDRTLEPDRAGSREIEPFSSSGEYFYALFSNKN